MKKTYFVVWLLALAALATGCNTINGMGKDFERAGEKVQSMSKK
jgi:predicted small secreted protein